MPTIPVDKADLFELIGRTYTTEEFDELCFDFGIELDEDTTEECAALGERPQLKIEIPANRYDMLCIEGIAQALNEFLGNCGPPALHLNPPTPAVTMTVAALTLAVRPYAAAAILRGVTFDARRYQSFIALQDKLHTNLCRNRTLVAMGTHDLDALTPPFFYEALAPQQIKFAPLNQDKEMDGAELMEFYDKDKNLGKYLHIIRDLPVYPVILDSQRTVASLPPIINSNRSKILVDTKNVFIEVTATDKTKAEIVINQLVAMFSRYCQVPFEIEPVQIISEHNGETHVTPNITPRVAQAEISYINSCLGLQLAPEEISRLLGKMLLSAAVLKENSDLLDVLIPCTRSDILHQCDIMEDAAIAYGYNNLVKTKPSSSEAMVASPLPINKVGDILRLASAQAGYLEVLPLTLSSHDENFKFLRRVDDNTTAVKLENPKTVEYQVVRTTLVPGILKTIKENRKHSLPIKVFECGDIVLKDDELERGAYNKRKWAAIYAGKTSGFEFVQGLLGKLMQTMRTPWLEHPSEGGRGYWIEEDDKNATFFPGRGAKVWFRSGDGERDQHIGAIGVLHPEVMNYFEVPFAALAVEIDAEVFL
jgi:phenylalanyl-tRNA synthetase beta chain